MVLSEARFLHDSDSSDAGEDVPLAANYFGSSKQNAEEVKNWDVFEDPPIKKEVGSLVSNKKFEVLTKIVKVIAYLLTFFIVLACGVISKGTLLFMTSQLKRNRKVDYCNRDIARNKQFISIIPEEQRLAWAWALIFVFMAPEIGTFIRSFRICVFKTYKTPSLGRFVIVMIMESLHTLGLAMLVFVILPELDVVKGVMLTNCFCFIPAVFGMLSRDIDRPRSAIIIGADVVAICAQVTGFVVWPLLEGKTELYFIPLAVVLISCGWWENYVLNKSSIRIVQQIAAMKDKFTTGRYFTYLFISPWKCLLFFLCAIIALWTRDENISHFFNYYSTGFGRNKITLIDVTPVLIADNPNTGGSAANFIPSTDNVLTYVIIIQVLAGYICYVFGKFACKVVIQGFSYALPICLTVPVSVSALIYMCGLRLSDPCYYHNIIPPYLFFNSPPLYSFTEYITEQHAWVWIFWIASQVWITLHIWTPQNERLVATEKIFVTPMYSGLLVDQSLAMNRKQHDIEPRKYVRKIEIDPEVEMRRKPKVSTSEDPNANEKTSRVIVCGTMWHENKEEMIEFLKSIMRLDEDQCSRRIAKQYFNYYGDTDYYEVETHVFFDDAFTPCKDDPNNTQINSFVKLLINTMDEAASEVHQTHIRIRPPKAYPTPYGGRLIWTLPGKTLLIAHLKDKDRIRHKKRWSQVMYMYYMLGYRLMDLPISKEKKDLLAKNTYILALDGDIDFKPQAVLLLIDLMKRNANLAAACGRIHPVGTGPMVWYQKFEYAIGHWLQKATEHMIGCVLCSPGCFSLFRAEALMDKNVMKRYTTKSDQAKHFVQYDQGEDRWLCTLLLQRGWRVEYSAASDAYTHCPEGFNEFYNQRRRWIPSTIANIFDLLFDAKRTVKANPDISHLYIFYEIIMMAGSILGPGTIFLMLVGAFVAAFKIDNWTSFTYNLVPILIFMAICLLFDSKIQLFFAGFISAVYGLVMIAVIVGLMVQISEDGPLAPSSLFFFIVAGELIIAAILHPQEIGCLPYGLIYYVTVPSMYMLLIVYAAFNMNDVSWGTREVAEDNPANKTKKKLEEEKKALEKGNTNASTTDKILNFLKNDKTKEEQGSVEFSFAGLFKCMLCTHEKNSEEKIQLIKLANSVNSVSRKLERLERAVDPSSANRRRTTINSLRGENGLPPLPDEEGDISISESDDGNGDQSDIPKLKEVRDFLQNPYWIDDPVLSRSQVDFLPDEEKSFWNDLIKKYLDPIKTTLKEEKRIKADLKDLRDKVVFAFFMLNSLFVLVIFLLQMNKDLLHIRWPLGVKSNITFDSDQNEITIKNQYLELEPIGVIFLLFFALVLVIQFTAMLFHRMGTLSHILAITKLNIFRTKDQKRKSAKRQSEITVGSDMVELARRMMSLKFANEVDEEEDEDTPAGRRKTIHHLESLKNRRRKVWKLEEAFNLRYEDHNITDNKKVFKDLRISTQDLKIIEKRRTTIVAENVAKRKSQMHREVVPSSNGGFDNANPDFESRGRSGFEPYFPDTDTMRSTRPKLDYANDIEYPK